MELLIFEIKKSQLNLTSNYGEELVYSAKASLDSHKLFLSTGGSILDYEFEIYVRGQSNNFEFPEEAIGRILSTIKVSDGDKRLLKIQLNTSKVTFDNLQANFKSKILPKRVCLSFDEEKSELNYVSDQDSDEFNYFWDNLCKYWTETTVKNNLFLVDYKFEI